MQPLRGNEIAIGTLMRRNRVVPTCQPRSALKGPVLVPRARGFLMTGAKRLDRQDSNANIPNRAQLSVRRKSALSLVVAPIASELMPGQGQFDQSLPIGPFGRRGALHRRLGFMLGSYLVHMRPSLTSRYGQVRGNFVRMIAEDESRTGVRVSARWYRDRSVVATGSCAGSLLADDVTSKARRQREPDRAGLRIFLILQTAGPVDGFAFGAGCDGFCPLGNSVLLQGAARTSR